MKKILLVFIMILTLLAVLNCKTERLTRLVNAEEPNTYYVLGAIAGQSGYANGNWVMKCKTEGGKIICKPLVQVQDN